MKALFCLLFFAPYHWSGQAQPAASHAINLTNKDEPGERLFVSGVVFGEEKKPLRGVAVYVYQTDAKGYYTREDARDSDHPRIKGTIATNEHGQYAFQTIKPGSYPNTRNPAHIHYAVKMPGYRKKVFEIVFEKDPFVDERIRAEASKPESGYSIRQLAQNQQGILTCTQDIQLEKQ